MLSGHVNLSLVAILVSRVSKKQAKVGIICTYPDSMSAPPSLCLVGGSRGGWVKDAQTTASRLVTDEEGNGRDWRVSQVMLVDLAEIDQDLSD